MSLLFFAITLFTPAPQALAEYIPGRTRTSAEGNLAAREATGVYKGVTEAHVLQEETDGQGITHFTVRMPGQTEVFKVVEKKRERCADTILAQSEAKAELRLTDRSFTTCDPREEETMWTVEIASTDAENSRLLLNGDAEHYYLSQDDEQKQGLVE